MHPELIERLSRQTLLPQIGEEGRDRIAAARFLVIGAGGLGSPATATTCRCRTFRASSFTTRVVSA